MPRARVDRGFTLIELMIVVAVLGVLASVAVPTFYKGVLRTKTAERTAVMLRIKQAILDYYVRNGTSIPPGFTSPVIGGQNPPGDPLPSKRSLSTTLGAWNAYFSAPDGRSSLPVEIEGAVYYRYSFTVVDTPEAASITVQADGDLDGDGHLSVKTITYTRVSGAYQLTGEDPPAGEEDEAADPFTF